MKLKKLIWLNILLLVGCDNYPRDPDKTLEQVRNGTLVVGYTENPPWVINTPQEPTGLEPQLIKEFAAALNARVQWQKDSEQDLFERLEKKELHLVIGGLTAKNEWKKKISFTQPYLEKEKKKYVMAIRKGENAFVLQLEKYLHQQSEKLKKTTTP
ncbi:MAG: transporter substrate-binding domain-containing protein [Adhaeribacter sp.]